jgi:flagellar motor switch protein FliG
MEDILKAIAENDAALADKIRNAMFVFEDLASVDQQGIKALLAKVDRKVLTMALKGTSEQLRDLFTKCMSQRGAEMLREDMEALGPVRLKDVEASQQQIIALARQLEAEGGLTLRPSESDRYVM